MKRNKSRKVNIYDAQGRLVDTILAPEPIRYVKGRISKGCRYFYKGLGAPYIGRASQIREQRVVGYTGVPYAPYWVQNKYLIGKCGIFLERFQPYFSDYIGGCGPKEYKVVERSVQFEYSAIEVHDITRIIDTPPHYFVTFSEKPQRANTEADKRKAINELLEYMVMEGWNFPWDKNSIRDITPDGMVHDPADLFRSHALTHQLGTIYSVAHSMYSRSQREYYEIFKSTAIPIEVAYFFLKSHGVGIDAVVDGCNTRAERLKRLYSCLITGRSCATLEDPSKAQEIVGLYQRQFEQSLSKKLVRESA